ncbi:MAG: class I SAM-dependent methyltransferase [Pseudomonadota bacterium]
MIHAAAVIIPTILLGQLRRAVRSVFEQDLQENIQILLGIDHAEGGRDIVEDLTAECPENRTITVLDLGYSTSSFRGGFYRNASGGAVRTMLSYAANSRYLAYLDEGNWWAPNHIRSLLEAVRDADWAYSYRWYVDPATQQPLFIDEWESVGPNNGRTPETQQGFVDANCLMVDKQKCHWDLPAWCVAMDQNGAGADRAVFGQLKAHRKPAATGQATAFYVFPAAATQTIMRLGEQRTNMTPAPERQPSIAPVGPSARKSDGEDPPSSNLGARLDRIENAVTTLSREFRIYSRTTLPQLLIQVTKQAEALDMLLKKLRIDRGWLPPTRGWAASPDFLLTLADHILESKANRVLECGSGVSSLVIGRCLELIGGGHLHSLEHLEASAKESSDNVNDRGLASLVTIVRAPLKPYQFHGQAFRWYDLAALPDGEIDCLVVDGPPLDTCPVARYPAAPMLFGRIADGGTVFLDDYNRHAERQAVKAWLRDFPDWNAVAKQTEKGCAVLRQHAQEVPAGM